jgi:hypothetical protein
MKRGSRLDQLLVRWQQFADSLAGGYEFDLDDYLNDLDVRGSLADAMRSLDAVAAAALQAQLRGPDGLVQRATEPVEICLWGSANAALHGYDPATHWWYYAAPRRRSAAFERDLARLR